MSIYYRLRLGEAGAYAKECFAENFIGADYDIAQNLTGKLPDEFRAFNREFIPVYLEGRPDKTRIAAGLACGSLWTVCKGIKNGERVLCPDGTGTYHIGEIAGDYYYQPGAVLPHRRPVHWLPVTIERDQMSEGLRNAAAKPLAVISLKPYSDEIDRWIAGVKIISPPEDLKDPSAFAMEKHLEDFLVQNWTQTNLGREYDIYQEDGKQIGQQYLTDTGPLDILAVSKDKKSLLVVELKKGRASDAVVGQTLRYMGYVKDELAEPGQDVRGVIIALEDDQRIRRALAVVPNIKFYRYKIKFELI